MPAFWGEPGPHGVDQVSPQIWGKIGKWVKIVQDSRILREHIDLCSLKNMGRLSTQQVVQSSLIMEGTWDTVDQVSADVKGEQEKETAGSHFSRADFPADSRFGPLSIFPPS